MSYPNLPNITDPAHQRALKVIADRLNALETRQRGLVTQTLPTLVQALDLGGQPLSNHAPGVANQDAVTLAQVDAFINQVLVQQTITFRGGRPGGPGVPPGGPPPPPPPPPGPPGVCVQDITKGQPGGVPNSLRWFRGNFCGIRVDGIPNVPQGPGEAALVFTPFIDRYSPTDQATILSAYAGRGYTHMKVSWPDSRDGAGQSVGQFVATCQTIAAAGINPVVFLAAKGNDDPGNYPAIVGPVVGALMAAEVLPICCVGWELSLWMSPTQVQNAIDFLAGMGVTEAGGHNLYVHFQSGYAAYQQPGHFTSAFWQANVGKLTGLLWQSDPGWACDFLQAKAADIQSRMGGGSGWPRDSGFGHPFDCVGDELTAMSQFFGGESEGAGNQVGFNLLCSPGAVPIMGSNNGFHL